MARLGFILIYLFEHKEHHFNVSGFNLFLTPMPEREKKTFEQTPTAGIEPRPPAWETSALSITPLPLGQVQWQRCNFLLINHLVELPPEPELTMMAKSLKRIRPVVKSTKVSASLWIKTWLRSKGSLKSRKTIQTNSILFHLRHQRGR